MKSKIYYKIANTDEARYLMMGDMNWIKEHNPELAERISKRNFDRLYKLLAVVEERDLEKIFVDFQAENWSPNGEARELINALGLFHTSISTGDIIQQGEKYYICAFCGYTEI